ncbi:hypothetical protein VB773_08445 [Haloarculaceae archaeon H-GB2-1]|nr:hypothetical protein [Haloarculaceae archaeon H-GB1-1]MEA5386086.1 hypothetical protein [Haloarculaceae archaeon H-GB11]MEA5407592.1 hypothetical protein [Haloarculaceae archaeon H-GB2-1]
MNRTLMAGLVLSVVGLAGYAVGLTVPYTGRAFSVTAVMAGTTLAAIGYSLAGETQ